MDIRKFAVEDTSTINLTGANDEPLIGDDGQPLTVTVFGPGSKQYARAQAIKANSMLNKIKRRGPIEQTSEEKAREEANFLAACTKEMSSNIEYDELKGDALYKALYADPSVGFIAEQVAKHIADWSNFTKPSTTS